MCLFRPAQLVVAAEPQNFMVLFIFFYFFADGPQKKIKIKRTIKGYGSAAKLVDTPFSEVIPGSGWMVYGA